MSIFGFNKKLLFGKECMREFMDIALSFGLINEKKQVTSEDLIKYGNTGINIVLKHDSNHYDDVDDFCENAFYFTLYLGLVLASKLKYDTLSDEYFYSVIKESPGIIGEDYLIVLGLNDDEHPFIVSLFEKYKQLYEKYKSTDKKRKYLDQSLLVVFLIGNTIALQ